MCIVKVDTKIIFILGNTRPDMEDTRECPQIITAHVAEFGRFKWGDVGHHIDARFDKPLRRKCRRLFRQPFKQNPG